MSVMQGNVLSTPAIVATATADEPKISMIGTGAYLIEAPGAFDLPTQRRIWALAHAVEAWPEVWGRVWRKSMRPRRLRTSACPSWGQ